MAMADFIIFITIEMFNFVSFIRREMGDRIRVNSWTASIITLSIFPNKFNSLLARLLEAII